jgi:hypothetical protein
VIFIVQPFWNGQLLAARAGEDGEAGGGQPHARADGAQQAACDELLADAPAIAPAALRADETAVVIDLEQAAQRVMQRLAVYGWEVWFGLICHRSLRCDQVHLGVRLGRHRRQSGAPARDVRQRQGVDAVPPHP